ncbi:MAG: VWA-like domain-containing protein [Planctomycetaceae bacterium]|jgi:predicted metal-dependent peptidase|nr:VWA-like domain-containing protein [Planctomycetaceae bacterium]
MSAVTTGRIVGPSSAEETEAIARSRVELARMDLLLDHPYFATALFAMPMRGTDDASLAHAVVTDGARIAYHFERVAALERPKVRLLLMHALSHALLRHNERGEGRDWTRWTAACDIAVTQLLQSLGAVPPAEDERLDDFAGLSAEAIYEKLDEPGGPSNDGASPEDGLLPPPSGGGHSDDPQADAQSRDAFDRALQGAEMPTATTLAAMRWNFDEAAQHAGAKLSGDRPGSGSAEIDAANSITKPWQTLLACFMREPLGREWSLARPNRKHLWRGLYLPGPMDLEGGRFVVAIDTSGSMTNMDLAKILEEIDAIRTTLDCELTVLQFDAAVHAVAEFSRWSDTDERVGSTRMMRVFGRGGTDLRLPFQWTDAECRAGRRVSALIVCTDGFGPLPTEPPPDLPVLFLLTKTHAAPAFGTHVVMEQAPARR